MKTDLRVWSLVVLAATASKAFAEQPGAVTQRPVFVIVQDYSGSAIATLLPSGNEKYLRKLSEDFDGLQAALPNVDILGLIRENFCRELAGAPADRCDQVSVSERRMAPRTVTASAGAASPLLVALSIEYAVDPIYADVLKIVATYAIHDAHKELRSGLGQFKKSADPVLQVAYYEAAPSELVGSPFRIPRKPSKKDLQKHAAARAYWLEGTPSRLEKNIRRALREVAEIGHVALPPLVPEAPEGAFAKWISGVPLASELRDSGKLECQKGGCEDRILRMDESRVWRVSRASLPRYIVSTALPAARTKLNLEPHPDGGYDR
jgi:hypothetical protein